MQAPACEALRNPLASQEGEPGAAEEPAAVAAGSCSCMHACTSHNHRGDRLWRLHLLPWPCRGADDYVVCIRTVSFACCALLACCCTARCGPPLCCTARCGRPLCCTARCGPPLCCTARCEVGLKAWDLGFMALDRASSEACERPWGFSLSSWLCCCCCCCCG